jgi:hypothetical protein
MRRKWLLVSTAAILVGGTLIVLLRLTMAAPAPFEPDDLKDLVRQARSKDRDKRGRAVGKLLKHLRPGMTREQVEALIGPPHYRPPDWRADQDFEEDGEGTFGAIYYCAVPGYPGNQMMSVEYDIRARPFKFIKVCGPHIPGD